MKFSQLKRHFEAFDTTGMDKNTISTLWLLIFAIMGGTVWSNVVGGVAYAGFWKKLGASDSLYGLIVALPSMAYGLQFLASYMLERLKNRKTLYLIAGFANRLVWFPFALIPLVIPQSNEALRLWSAGILVLVYAASGPVMNVVFYSICNDVLPMRIRGRYFAVRTRIATIVGLLAGIVIGILLDSLEGMMGYTVVFLIAAVFGTLDTVCFVFMKLPPMRVHENKVGIAKMLGGVLRDKGFMRVVVFCTVWTFSVQICAPYFNVYMQTVMGLSNLNITLFTQVIASAVLVLAISHWGRAVDHYGSKPVMVAGAVSAVVFSLAWTFIGGKNNVGVILAFIFNGATWCAYDLGATNLFMNKSGKENTSMYTAMYFALTQLAGCALGSTMGGLMLDGVLFRLEALNIHLFGFALSRYNYLFALSGILRFITLVVFLPGIHEENAKSMRTMLGEAGRACGRSLHGNRHIQWNHLRRKK